MDLCSVVKTLLITSSFSPRIDWNSNNSAISCAFSGNDLANSLTKSKDCGPLCASTADCTHYTWTDFNSGTCWMKKNKVSKSDAFSKLDQNAVCGIVDNSYSQIQWDTKNSALRCAFSGNDLRNNLSKPDDCHVLCASTPDCTHYTWTDFNSGTCWMKANVVSKSEAIVKLDQHSICGVIEPETTPYFDPRFIVQDLSKPTRDSETSSLHKLRFFSKSTRDSATSSLHRLHFSSKWKSAPAINSTTTTGVSESGRSTRYWDCCKPSCSWDGKASVTSPVNSCNQDGYNVIDRNARNGCESGGNAFTCNNNIPWAINDDLAYGFAAANIEGQTEGDWCCKCYELTFTSGPVSGKKMIVQVTNTGGDLGENHFDLQMPGGGVGIFNGCSAQWNAPDGGWGDRYGGVHSLEECDQLPSEIREGCQWRFQWFQGADNPSFNFIEVGCPDELTSKTGCARN